MNPAKYTLSHKHDLNGMPEMFLHESTSHRQRDGVNFRASTQEDTRPYEHPLREFCKVNMWSDIPVRGLLLLLSL